MLTILGVTLAASAVDCLNPVTLTQQFLLQGLVRKKRDVLFFILGVFLVNYAFGLLVYYGLTTLLRDWWRAFFTPRMYLLLAGEVLLGLGCIALSVRMWRNARAQNATACAPPQEKEQAYTRGFGAPAMFVTGVVACTLELSSAMPYFAFLAFLLRYSLSPATLLCILLLYNLVYIAPQLVLYAGYSHFQHKIEPLYRRLQQAAAWLNRHVLPAAVGLAGTLLAAHGCVQLL